MLGSLALILLCGLLFGSLFKKIKLPSLVGMLLTGIILGPHVLNLLDPTIILIGPDLRQIALIIILTKAGLSLDLEDLKSVGGPAILMSFIPAIFEMTATIIFAPILFKISYLDAALLGAVIASASPAVIIPRMLKLIEEGYGTDKKIPQMILASDSIDDVFNITIFTLLIGIQTGQNNGSFVLLSVPISMILGIVIGILSGFLLSDLFKKIHIRDSNKVIILLGIGFMFIYLENILSNIVPFSGLLAIMVNGIIILKQRPLVAKRLTLKFTKLWTAAEIILFVLIGALVDINYASKYLLLSITLLVIILIIRGIGILICLIKTDFNKKERTFTALSGIPKATVQAAIGAIPLTLGLSSGELILSVAVIAILFTAPLGALIIDSTYKKLLNHNII